MTCSILGRALELVAHGIDRDPRRLLERKAADPGAERRERDARGADLAGTGHGAADGGLDDGSLVRRSRSSDTAWITALAARFPAGVTMDSPSGTGAWRTAANSISSPPARLSAPPTPVDIHSDRLAAFTIASTSSSQISPFHSSIRAKFCLPHRSVSVRRPTGPAAAWYTRGNRRAIAVTTSHVFVVRVRARSSAVIRSSPWPPRSTNSSWA